MDEVRNQLELTNEISQAISDPAGMGIDVSCAFPSNPSLSELTDAVWKQVDDQELADELAELEQEELNKRLAGAEAAPVHSPAAAVPAGAFFSPSSLLFRLLTFFPLSSRNSQDPCSKDRGGRGRSRAAGTSSSAGDVIALPPPSVVASLLHPRIPLPSFLFTLCPYLLFDAPFDSLSPSFDVTAKYPSTRAFPFPSTCDSVRSSSFAVFSQILFECNSYPLFSHSEHNGAEQTLACLVSALTYILLSPSSP
jgi:hypothetical protein